jgi:hypothetical protein
MVMFGGFVDTVGNTQPRLQVELVKKDGPVLTMSYCKNVIGDLVATLFSNIPKSSRVLPCNVLIGSPLCRAE